MYYIDSCGALIFDFCYPQKKKKITFLYCFKYPNVMHLLTQIRII